MTTLPRVHLPDLTGPEPAPTPSGWMALYVQPDPSTPNALLVSVPSRDDARRCAATVVPGGGCVPTVVSFDPPDGTTLIALGADGSLSVHVRVTPGVLDGEVPQLTVQLLPTGATVPPVVTIDGEVRGVCRDRVVFTGVVVPPAANPAAANGTYVLSLVGYAGPTAEITLALGGSPPIGVPIDPCAITLMPTRAAVGVALLDPPSTWPSPPLLAVDAGGCIVAAWAVNERGWILVPRKGGAVDLLQSDRGGVRARLKQKAPIVDAIFWDGVIAALTATTVTLYDLGGQPLPTPVFTGFTAAVALGISDEGFLLVIDSGATPNVHYLRRDGSRALAPAAFASRGWYAKHRSPAFVISDVDGSYTIDPALAVTVSPACCVAASRALTDDEALLFEMIDDLPDLRERFAWPLSGQTVLGSGGAGDVLDAGRLGTQWHRILLFGEIPAGCAVAVETRSFDDPLLMQLARTGDPQSQGGWSRAVVASPASAGPVEAPADLRTVAGDVLVLAGPGRYLWVRLTLQSDGRSTPRITSIELEQPRAGTSRYLPKVFRDSTPEDDFLRRWLALFEETGWSGIATRLDDYAALFDPRTCPAILLPYIAGWLQIPLYPQLVADTARLRVVLTRANDLAEGRGTIDGLVLAAKLYLGITIQIVESYATRSRFILGVGQTILGQTGPILGGDTVLTMEPSPTWLGEEVPLGASFLLDGDDDRDGAIAWHFDVLVPARQVCSSEDLSLLQSLIETEKPAFTTYSIRQVGAAGWVLGVASIVGQEITAAFDRRTLNPSTYGLVILNGPPRPKPIGLGFTLGQDARLTAPPGNPRFQIEATVGKTTRVGA